MHVHVKIVATPSSTSTATLCIFVLCTTTYTLGDPQILQYWSTETRPKTFKFFIPNINFYYGPLPAKFKPVRTTLRAYDRTITINKGHIS